MDRVIVWVWKVWAFIWCVLVNLIELAVLLIIFSSAESRFESIVFSLLVMIYLTIRSSFALMSYAKQKEIVGTVGMFNHIRKLLKDDITSEELTALEEEEKKWGGSNSKMWVNLIFVSIFYLVALFNLFRVTILNS